MRVGTFCISAVVDKSVQPEMCNYVLSYHQEYAAQAIPAYNRSVLCDRETSSSHCPSTHLNNVIRLTESSFRRIKRRWFFMHVREEEGKSLCFKGYRINIAQQVCCCLFSSSMRWPLELGTSPWYRLHWTSSPEKVHAWHVLRQIFYYFRKK